MPFLNEEGLQTLWTNTKNWFAKWIDSTPTEDGTQVKIDLKSGQKDEAQSTVLDTAYIPSATHTTAGVLTAVDKTKLDGIAEGATANTGTIEEIESTSPIVGSGTSGKVSLSHAASGVASGTYGTTLSAQLTPSFGATFSVPGFKVDERGHITEAGGHLVKLPNSNASQTASGLMSSTDKTKLDNIAEGATANTGTIESITSTSPISGSGTSGTITISHETSGVTAGSYGPSGESDRSPAFGGPVKTLQLTIDNTGHITGATEYQTDIPNYTATATESGLMSSQDKTKLDGVAEGATKNEAATQAPSNISDVASVGNSAKYAKEDHIHKVEVSSNPSNGEITVAGQKLQVVDLASFLHLDANGNVTPSSGSLDVFSYASFSAFPESGMNNKLYIDESTNNLYYWNIVNNQYVKISGDSGQTSLTLGETETTAYRGDRGAAAYKHAVTNKGSEFASGLYKIATNSEGHVTEATEVIKKDITDLGIPSQDTVYTHPTYTEHTAAAVKVGNDATGHVIIGDALTKSDVGLANVDNKSSDTIRSEITSENVTTALGYTPGHDYIAGDGISITQDTSGFNTITNSDSHLGLAWFCEATNIDSTESDDIQTSYTAYCSNYTTRIGNIIAIRFSSSNLYDSKNMTLNVGDSGAFTVAKNGLAVDASNPLLWDKDDILYFSRAQDYYEYLGATRKQISNEVYFGQSSTSKNSEYISVTSALFSFKSGAVIAIAFISENTVNQAIQLNVNNTGFKNIWLNGSSVSASNPLKWSAGTVMTFCAIGNYYYCLSSSQATTATADQALTTAEIDEAIRGEVIEPL